MRTSPITDPQASDHDAAGLIGGRYQALPLKAVVWGEGSRTRLGVELDRLGKNRALVITTRSLQTEGRLLQELTGILDHRFCGLGKTVPAHVPLASVLAIAEQVRQDNIDAIIAFGGGSVIDAAKAAVHVLADGKGRHPLIAAVPTTLSGAEFSHFFGVTEEGSHGVFKRSFACAAATPALVVLDPAVTEATPEALWSSSAIKALDHAIEGLVFSPAAPVTDVVALAGIRRMTRVLSSSDRYSSRLRMEAQLAAWSCFFAAANMQFGLSHRIGHVLGGSFRIAHSLTSGVTLAPVLDAFATLEPVRLRMVANALHPADRNDGSEQAGDAAARLRDLVVGLRLPTRLRELGLGSTDVQQVATRVAEQYPDAAERLGPAWRRDLTRLIETMY